jgi:hypothetical protein
MVVTTHAEKRLVPRNVPAVATRGTEAKEVIGVIEVCGMTSSGNTRAEMTDPVQDRKNPGDKDVRVQEEFEKTS